LTASALGLGEISLRSALNQPFVAEIPVTSDSAEDLGQLSVQLAPAATFERYGLDRPRFLDDLKFQVQRDGGRTIIRLTSTQPISEPFVSVLLDVTWPQGRLLREYTVLLDPPTFARPGGAGQVSSQPVAAPPSAAGPAAPPPAIRRAPPAETAPAVRNSDTGGAPSVGRVTSGSGGDSYGPVRANETLWRISERLRTDSNVSVNQMMVALYRANPEAFAGNINRLRRGAILRVPRGSELTSIASREATAEVKRQNQEWRGAVGAPTAPARLQLVPPAEQAAGTASGTAAATGTASREALEKELAEKERLVSLQNSQLKALQDRISQLEGAPPPVPATAPADVPVEQAVAPADAGDVAPVVADKSAVDEDQLPAKRAVRERPAAGGGILDTLSGLILNAWFLVSAAAVLLAGLFFVFGRRRMVAADEASGRFDREFSGGTRSDTESPAPVVRREGYSVEEAGDRSAPAVRRAVDRDSDAETPLERTISTDGAVELDQADVVAEANFHLAYGLYDQAAELLVRALRDSPDRRDLRLKLIEVYFVWENKAAFLKEAQTFHRQLKGAADPDWNKVVILGKQICPGEALFAGAVVGTGDSGLDLDLVDDDKGAVDFSFDELGDEGLDLQGEGADGDSLDFDPGSLDEASTEDSGLTSTSLRKPGAMPPTAEVPTIEAPRPGEDFPTMETPTVEFRGPGEKTLETPTLESAVPGLQGGVVDPLSASGADQTEEINLEDLGLDLSGLDEVADDLGTGVHGALVGDDDASGSDAGFDLSSEADDESDLLQSLEGDSTAEMRGMALDEGTLDASAFGNAMEKSAASKEAARDFTAETAAHQTLDDTAEQPRAAETGLGEVSGELSQVDFDIGEGASDDDGGELEPTSVMTGRRRGPEGPTMTEVGTKLDLARAYVDMGDPDGARSILNEVLEEGDSAQRQEARRLLDDLTD
jgi:pilus assembly protein FimV